MPSRYQFKKVTPDKPNLLERFLRLIDVHDTPTEEQRTVKEATPNQPEPTAKPVGLKSGTPFKDEPPTTNTPLGKSTLREIASVPDSHQFTSGVKVTDAPLTNTEKARIVAATGLRVAGPWVGSYGGGALGATAAAAAATPETGGVGAIPAGIIGAKTGSSIGGAIGGALGEAGAELIEPRGHGLNAKRIGVSTALGGVPGAWLVRHGKPLYSGLMGLGMGYTGTAGYKAADGTPLQEAVDPRTWSKTDVALGPVAGGTIGAGLGLWTRPPKPPDSIDELFDQIAARQAPITPATSDVGRGHVNVSTGAETVNADTGVEGVVPKGFPRVRKPGGTMVWDDQGRAIDPDPGKVIEARRQVRGSRVSNDSELKNLENATADAEKEAKAERAINETQRRADNKMRTKEEAADLSNTRDTMGGTSLGKIKAAEEAAHSAASKADTTAAAADVDLQMKEFNDKIEALNKQADFIHGQEKAQAGIESAASKETATNQAQFEKDSAQQARNLDARDKYLADKADQQAAQDEIDRLMEQDGVQAGQQTVTQTATKDVPGGKITSRQSFYPPIKEREGTTPTPPEPTTPPVAPTGVPPREVVNNTRFATAEAALAAGNAYGGGHLHREGRGNYRMILWGEGGAPPPGTPPPDIPPTIAPTKPPKPTPPTGGTAPEQAGIPGLTRETVEHRTFGKEEAEILAKHTKGRIKQVGPRKWMVEYPPTDESATPTPPPDEPPGGGAARVGNGKSSGSLPPQSNDKLPANHLDRGDLSQAEYMRMLEIQGGPGTRRTPAEREEWRALFGRFNQKKPPTVEITDHTGGDVPTIDVEPPATTSPKPVDNGPEMVSESQMNTLLEMGLTPSQIIKMSPEAAANLIDSYKGQSEAPLSVPEFASALSKEGEKPVADLPFSLTGEAAKAPEPKQPSILEPTGHGGAKPGDTVEFDTTYKTPRRTGTVVDVLPNGDLRVKSPGYADGIVKAHKNPTVVNPDEPPAAALITKPTPNKPNSPQAGAIPVAQKPPVIDELPMESTLPPEVSEIDATKGKGKVTKVKGQNTVNDKIQFAKDNFSPEANAELDKLGAEYRTTTDTPTKREIGQRMAAIHADEMSRIAREAKGTNVEPTAPGDLESTLKASLEAQQGKSLEDISKMHPVDQVNTLEEEVKKALAANPNLKAKPKGGTTLSMNLAGQWDDMRRIASENPTFVTRLGLGTAGAVAGAIANPDDPITGALIGAGAGAFAPTVGRALLARVRDNPGMPSATIQQIGDKIRDSVETFFRVMPDYQRFVYLTHPTSLPLNAWVGPWGSAIMAGMEEALQGSQKGRNALRLFFNPKNFPIEWKRALGEAHDLIYSAEERTEGTLGNMGPPAIRKITALPGEWMTAGDVAARKLLMRAGYTAEEARAITLTSEPYSATGKMISSAKKGAIGAITGKRGWFANMALPFHRTATNQVEQNLERLPGVGLIWQRYAKGAYPSLGKAIVQHGLSLGAGSAGYMIGTVVPEEDSKFVNKFLSNFGGQYGLIMSAGFVMGQAQTHGRSKIGAAGRVATEALPQISLDSINNVINDARKLSGEEDRSWKAPFQALPGVFYPKNYAGSPYEWAGNALGISDTNNPTVDRSGSPDRDGGTSRYVR